MSAIYSLKNVDSFCFMNKTGIADLDGDSTDGLNLHLVNISLERVKTLFSDESKLAVRVNPNNVVAMRS